MYTPDVPITWDPPADPKLWPPQPTLTGDQIADYAAQSIISSEGWCQNLNNNLIVIYTGAINNYNASTSAGRPAPGPIPAVPMAYLPVGPDANGYYSYDISTTPVCAPLAVVADTSVPPTPVANNIDIGPNIGGKWFSVGADDTFPAGMTTPPIPDASGVLHTYEKFAAPVGAGWYLQVS